jgi:hypothetical protein
MVLLCLMPLRRWPARLCAGAVLGGVLGAFVWLNWPQCLTSAYQISPELAAKWLSNIREAKPVTAQSASGAIPMLALPVLGVLGALAGCWSVRRNSERLWAWGTVALMTIFALALTFWQIRAAPAAQLLSIPTAAFALTTGAGLLLSARWGARIGGAAAVLLVLGIFNASEVYSWYARASRQWSGDVSAPNASAQARSARFKRIRDANARCRTLPALAALNKLPPATIFTLVDLGPRLIAATHHSAIAGPYHRNGDAILDIHHAFDGQPETFRAIAARHRASYFLLCPDFPEGTVYQSRSPRGFYAQASRGRVPSWLHPVNLGPSPLPYTLYRIDYGSAPVGKEGAQQPR